MGNEPVIVKSTFWCQREGGLVCCCGLLRRFFSIFEPNFKSLVKSCTKNRRYKTCLLVLPCRIGLWRYDVTRLELLPARNNLSSHFSRGRKTKLNSRFSSLFTHGFQSRWTRLRTCCFSRRDDEVSSHVYSLPPMVPTQLSGPESWNKTNVINCIINWRETSVQEHFI